MKKTCKHNRKLRRRLGSMLLALFVSATVMPVFAYDKSADSAGADGLEQVIPEAALPESDDLLAEYIDKGITKQTETLTDRAGADSGQDVLSGGTGSRRALSARRSSVLSDREQQAYEMIKENILAIAAGERDSAYFMIDELSSDDPAEPAIDYILIVNTLMAEVPAEFYWYDKVSGFLMGLDSTGEKRKFYFSVSPDYWDQSRKIRFHDVDYIYGVDTARTMAANAVIGNVTGMLSEFDGMSDKDKLDGYRSRICELVSYDSESERKTADHEAGTLNDPFYGDPWQLIYVFDGDPATNVVCEGYSKAFKYLCDLTEFEGGIECYIATGYAMQGTVNIGGHMWNILRMDDGGRYIADITSCDGASPGSKYFLKGYTSRDAADTYTYSDMTYVYDGEAFGGFYDDSGTFHKGVYTEEELTMADADYGTAVSTVFRQKKAAGCTAPGYKRDSWFRLGCSYADEGCTEFLPYNAVIDAARGHVWSSWKQTKAPTCKKKGVMTRKCSACGETRTKSIAAEGHRWNTTVKSLDYYKQKCSACGAARKVSRVTVDRPRVTIKAPVKAVKAFTVKWSKVNSTNRGRIDGIEIQYSTSRKFYDSKSRVKKAGKTSVRKKISGLKRNKTYFIRIRTYKKVDGKKHVSTWSAVRKVRTK